MDELMTTEEVAALLKISPATVRWHRHRGTGPVGHRAPHGRRVLYRRSEVEAWFASGDSHELATEAQARRDIARHMSDECSTAGLRSSPGSPQANPPKLASA